jgi:type I restriction enzyme, S subunit
MTAKWIKVTLGDLINAGTLLVSDGYRAKNEELGGDGLIFLRAGHVRETGIDFSGVEHFHAESFLNVRSKLSAPGDIIITTKGNSTGRTAFVTTDMPTFVYSPHLSFWRSLDHSRIVPEFLRAWVRGFDFHRQLTSMASSTDMAPYLSLIDQKRIVIHLPDISSQQAIARVLSAFDEKIELNRRTNQTLESLARAVFQSWFVTFDPVRARLEGRDYPLQADVLELFPRDFDGDVPRGWSKENIYQICNVIYGAPFASEFFTEQKLGLPLIRIRDLSTHNPTIYTPENHPKGTRVYPGNIIAGMDGEFRAHLWTGPIAWLNQRVCMFEPRDGVPSTFIRLSVETPLMFFERSKTATTVIHLGKADIDTWQVVVPPPEILASFAQVVEPITERIIRNAQESQSLTQTRDSLLPQLLSGEITVRDADQALEEL